MSLLSSCLVFGPTKAWSLTNEERSKVREAFMQLDEAVLFRYTDGGIGSPEDPGHKEPAFLWLYSLRNHTW